MDVHVSPFVHPLKRRHAIFVSVVWRAAAAHLSPGKCPRLGNSPTHHGDSDKDQVTSRLQRNTGFR